MPTETLRTDGQKDGRTDRIPISISRVSMLTRDKNEPCLVALQSPGKTQKN